MGFQDLYPTSQRNRARCFIANVCCNQSLARIGKRILTFWVERFALISERVKEGQCQTDCQRYLEGAGSLCPVKSRKTHQIQLYTFGNTTIGVNGWIGGEMHAIAGSNWLPIMQHLLLQNLCPKHDFNYSGTSLIRPLWGTHLSVALIVLSSLACHITRRQQAFSRSRSFSKLQNARFFLLLPI